MNTLRTLVLSLPVLLAGCEPEAGDSASPHGLPGTEGGVVEAPFLALNGRIVLRPAPGQLIGEVAAIVATDSAIWIADRIEADVKVFDWHGSHRRTLGRRGDGPGEFRTPHALTLLPRGRIAVLDRGRMRVSVWNHAGEEMLSWPHRMMVANSLATTPDQRLLLVGVTGTGVDARAAQIMDVAGNGLRRYGVVPPPTRPREGSMRVYIGDQVGNAVVYTHSATNEIWEAGPGYERSYRVAADAFREWAWHDQPQGPGAGVQGWLGEQTWLAKLFAVDDAHFIAAVGEPNMMERRFRFRYALTALGGDEIELSSWTDVELFPGLARTVFGVHPLDDGAVVLAIYHVRLPD
jgi:hypothetical protein